MAYIQSIHGAGTEPLTVTLSGVTAGSALAMAAADSSTNGPATHTVADGQGSYTAQAGTGLPCTDATTNTWANWFVLANANSGSHAAVITFDTGNGAVGVLIESSAPTTNPVTGSHGNQQNNPGTGTDALTSGSVPVSASATLYGWGIDATDASAADQPAIGTGFTLINKYDDGASLGESTMERLSVSSATAATFTAIVGASSYLTIGLAILEPTSSGGKLPAGLPQRIIRPPNLPSISRFLTPLGFIAPPATVTVDSPLPGYAPVFRSGNLRPAFNSPPDPGIGAPPQPRDESSAWKPVFRSTPIALAFRSFPDPGISAPPQPTREESQWIPRYVVGRIAPAFNSWPDPGISAPPPPLDDPHFARLPYRTTALAPAFNSFPATDLPTTAPPDNPTYYLARYRVGSLAPAIQTWPNPGISAPPPPLDDPQWQAPLFRAGALRAGFRSLPATDVPAPPPPSDDPLYTLARFAVVKLARAFTSQPDPGISTPPSPRDDPSMWTPSWNPLFRVVRLSRGFISQPDPGFSSVPPPSGNMPNLLGRELYIQATAELIAAGITPNIGLVSHTLTPNLRYFQDPWPVTIVWLNTRGAFAPGIVVAQSPAAGTQVAFGTTITLTVSSFPMGISTLFTGGSFGGN